MPPKKKTRRTAQAEADAEDNASQGTDRQSPPPAPAPHSSSQHNVSALLNSSDIDVTALRSILPDGSVDSPSPEFIISCYRVVISLNDQLVTNARELEDLRADAERKDVELDQALQDRETAVSDIETALESVQNELMEVKREKDELVTANASLEAQLSQIKALRSTSSHELGDLQRRVDEIEREKRNLLTIISRHEEDAQQSKEEVTQLRDSLKAARKEVQDLESNIREVRSSERSFQLKIETLTYQLKLAKDEAERTDSELSKKTDELSTYRRDKHTEIVQLQSELDSIKQTYNQTVSSLRSLQSSHQSQNQQLSQALQRVQDLTGQLADQDAKYSSETASLKRLVKMMEEREDQAKALVEGIEKDWEGLGAKAAASEQRLREALEEEQQRSAALEKEVDDMKLVMDRIERGELPVPPAGRPGTPRNAGEIPSDSLHGISPSLSLLSRMQRSGKTFTEVYADYVRVQDELARKTLEVDRLDRALTEMLVELEKRAPALAQQKNEIDRIQAESSQLAAQLSQALADRESLMIQSVELTQKYTKSERENTLLQQQLEDLGRQVRALLKDLGRFQDPTLWPDEDMENVPPAENVNDIITNNLVLFRSIPQLQEQNQKLLKITRELGAKMETEEREYKEQLDREQAEAIREAHEAIQALQMQLENQQRSHQLTLQAYAEERKTLRTTLSHYKQDVSDHDGTIAPQLNGLSHASSDLEKELEDIRNNFDSFKHETGVDSVKLRDEVVHYQREAKQFGAALAKANAKIEFLTDQHRMLQEQYTMQERDYQSLSRRNQQLYDQSTRLEVACNHASEELSNANAQVERLRNECSNLRAEKKIWENVQARLLEENKILSVERSRMADLMANVQKMHNDIERSNEGDRRRLESQMQALESQAQDLRSQLSRERDTIRQITLQKDLEVQELRTKIDRTVEDLSKARENLVGSDTSRKHLEERVEDLVKQVQMSQEKLTVYERRTVSLSGAGTSHAQAEGLSNEDQLKAEVAELRGSLKSVEVDLVTARNHVKQFQEISQASEAALESLSATHEQYKSAAEARIAKFESEQKAVDDRLTALNQELAGLNEKNSELQRTLEEERASFLQDKKTLEDTIVDITTAEMNSRTDQTSRESEIREHMEKAKVAEEKYSREVVAHAESIKVVDFLKKEVAEARATIRERSTAAETAQAKFIASEASWKQQKDALTKEIADLNARCKDLVAQNEVLHKHLESVSSQASRIRQAADSSVPVTSDGSMAEDSDSRLSELRSVVAYLRKEKEIVDLQLELSRQENARLQTQIEHLSRNLDETRSTLSSEREQAAQTVQSTAEHAELLERINQLNILRESNATLRAESDAHARKSRQLESSLRELQQELGPAREQVQVLRAEVEEKERQITQLESENQQWKERNSQLLTKYDRIDPNDVQALRDEIDDLQIDVRKYEEEKQLRAKEAEEKAEQLKATEVALSESRAKYSRLLEQSRDRLKSMNASNSLLKATNAELEKKLASLTAEQQQSPGHEGAQPTGSSEEIEALKSRLSEMTQAKDALVKRVDEEVQKAAKAAADYKLALDTLQTERKQLVEEKARLSSVPASDSAQQREGVPAETLQKLAALEAEKAELIKAREDAVARAKTAEDRAANLKQANEKYQQLVLDNERKKAAEREQLAQRHKQEQEEAVAVATAKLRTELEMPNVNDIATRHAEELRALEAKLAAKYEEDIKVAVQKAKESASSNTPAQPTSEEEKEAEKKAMEAAMERGRLEIQSKLKLKENMLHKAQSNVKQLEWQIQALRQRGIEIPDPPPTITPTMPKAGAAAPATPVTASTAPLATINAPSASTAAPSAATVNPQATNPSPTPKVLPSPLAASTSTGTAVPAAINALPRKPSLNIANAPTGTNPGIRGARGAAPRGARGGAVRGAGARGGAPGRGGAPAQVAQAAAAAAAAAETSPAGMSIMGAAAKRNREDSDTPESLAKRIKPAEAAPKPVALRRDRIPTTNPAPTPG